MGAARKLQLYLFLEGLRVPVKQVSVYAEAGHPARASIQIPPTHLLEDLPPKTHVLIFFEDLFQEQGDDITFTATQSIPFEKRVRLLFEGEVTRVSWSQSASGSFTSTIAAEDLSNYFSRALSYFFRGRTPALDTNQTVAFFLDKDAVKQQRLIRAPGRDGLVDDIRGILTSRSEESIPRAFREVYYATTQINRYFREANKRLRIVDAGLLSELADAQQKLNAAQAGQAAATPGTEQFAVATENVRQVQLEIDTLAQRSQTRPDRIGEPIATQLGRVALKDDPDVALLFSPLRFPFLVENVISNTDITLTLQQVMEPVLALMNYQFWPQLCPSFEPDTDAAGGSNRLNNFILKPTSWFTAPPAFNVMFPGSIDNVEFSRDFMSEPTRLMIKFVAEKVAGEGPEIVTKYFAPRGLNKALKAIYGDPIQSSARDITKRIDRASPFSVLQLNLSFIGLDDGPYIYDKEDVAREESPDARLNRFVMLPASGNDVVPLESDESLKGIIPVTHQIPLAVNLLAGTGDDTERYYSNLAEFLLFLRQHETRAMAVASDFNPNLAVGFPVLVLQDSVGPRFGELASLSHTLVNDAGGTTSIQVTYARQDDVLNVNGRPDAPLLRDVPLWMNKAYLPEFVDAKEFSADVRDPTDNFNTAKPLERGAGAWRAFFGGSGRAFWSALPAVAGSAEAKAEAAAAQRLAVAQTRLQAQSGVNAATVASAAEEVTAAKKALDELHGGGQFGFSQRAAAERLLAHYRSLDDDSRQDFMDAYTRRRIATLADLAEWEGFTIIGAGIPGGDVDQLQGGPFTRVSVRAQVELIRNDLAEQALRA